MYTVLSGETRGAGDEPGRRGSGAAFGRASGGDPMVGAVSWRRCVSRRSTSAVISAVCACLLLAGPAVGGDAGGSLAGYLRAVEELSPSIARALSGHEAALAGAQRVGWLPDPTVSYGYYFEGVETRVGPQTHRVGVRQRLPWFGKLFVAKDAGGERAAAASERLRAARLDVAVHVTRAFADYAYLAVADCHQDGRLPEGQRSLSYLVQNLGPVSLLVTQDDRSSHVYPLREGGILPAQLQRTFLLCS